MKGVSLAESLSDLFARLAPGELDAPLARILGESFELRGAGANRGVQAVGAFRGHLTESLFAFAGHPKSRAALVVVDEDAERALFFSAGRIVGATSNVLFERLGRVLYKSAVVTHEDAATLVRVEDDLGAPGLVGWLPDDVLRWAVARRVREVAAALPYVSRGHFCVVQGEASLPGLPPTAYDPGDLGAEARLLYEAWRRGTSEEAEAAAHAPDTPAPLPGPLGPPLTREEDVQDILRRVRQADIRLDGPGG
jgi:hypothetical protein